MHSMSRGRIFTRVLLLSMARHMNVTTFADGIACTFQDNYHLRGYLYKIHVYKIKTAKRRQTRRNTRRASNWPRRRSSTIIRRHAVTFFSHSLSARRVTPRINTCACCPGCRARASPWPLPLAQCPPQCVGGPTQALYHPSSRRDRLGFTARLHRTY